MDRGMIKVLALSLYGKQAASTRYRLLQYIPSLLSAGIEVDVNYLLDDDYVLASFSGRPFDKTNILQSYIKRCNKLLLQNRFDVAIIGTELFPMTPGVIESNLLRVPYIYDFDDAFYLKYTSERFRYVSWMLANKFNPVIARAATVLAGNEHLATHARLFNPRTRILPTVVDLGRYQCISVKHGNKFTVGWIGSPSTSVYLSEMAVPLARLGGEGPVRFVVVGGRCDPIDNVEVVSLPWNQSTEIEIINSFDVGVMPLFDNEWARGKCAFKLIQYMACGVPVVASRVGANIEVVDETSGFLAHTPDQWCESLRKLRDDPDLRIRMGCAGRKRIESHYSLQKGLPILIDTIRSIVANESK
jgi:glycosyltransferase involved in cell wall biosynthesis